MNTKEIESWIKGMCGRYNLNYKKDREEIWIMINDQVKATGEEITDHDIKEICKYFNDKDWVK